MKNFLAIMQLVTQLMSALILAVKSIEEAVPQAGQGSAKLAMIRAMLESAFKNLTDTTVTFEQLWPTLQVAIGSLVTIYNATGLFKTSKTNS